MAMGASTDLAMDNETRQRIDDLRRDVQRDRDRLNAKTLGLRFLGQPVSHPHRGMIWRDDPGYPGGPAGWTPRWSRFGGVWLCPIYVPNQDRSDVFSYDVFLDDINEEVCRKFRQHACEVAALLERLGCELSVGICRESELVRTLFERNRTEIHWEENEEPEHSETKSLIGRLKDIYGHTEKFLSDLLEEFTPISPKQHSQVNKETEEDRPGGKAEFAFQPDGDGYFIRGFGEHGHVTAKGARGLHDIFRLVQQLNVPVPMLELDAGAGSNRLDGDSHSQQPVADSKTRRDITAKRTQLRADIENADSDLERDELRAELETLEAEAKKMFALRGKARDLNNPNDGLRAKLLARKKRACKTMKDSGLSKLAEYLDSSIVSAGACLVYRSATPNITWHTEPKK
jgi:hypothetical protein